MLKPLHGMLKKESLPCYEQFTSDVKEIGHFTNPHDACVANKIIDNKQQTLTWHVDDAKHVLVSPKVNDEFAIWCEEKHGSDDLGHVTVTRGKRHDYLGMTLDYFNDKAVLIDMTEYIDQMKEDFPEKLEKNTKAWSDKLFSVGKNSKRICNEKSDISFFCNQDYVFM